MVYTVGNMLNQVGDFLKIHWNGVSSLLLGYSGGPDSKALLYALLELGCTKIHLAHIDHGWRPESGKEALELAKEAEILKLPFHTIRLPPSQVLGNQEERAREGRLAFFRSLFETWPFQALLLAHQAGDLAETALKRVLEGAHLPFLMGMEQVSMIHGIQIWRPMLAIERRQIFFYLREKKLKPLIDPTNDDPSYLRARMRKNILPSLAKSFGKEISKNLQILSHRSSELNQYLDRKIEHCVGSRGPWGLFFQIAGMERIEARHLLLTHARRQGMALPRVLLESLLDAGLARRPNCRFSSLLMADRGHVFFLSPTPPQWGRFPLFLEKSGSFHSGDWRIEMVESTREVSAYSTPDWKSVWTGSFSCIAAQGFLAPCSGSATRTLWNEKKVPAFFREQMPVLWKEETVIQEFLSGKSTKEWSRIEKSLLEKRSLFKLSFAVLPRSECTLKPLEKRIVS